MTVGQLITLLQTFDTDAEVIMPDESSYYGTVGDVKHDWAAPYPDGLCLTFRNEENARLMVRLVV